MPFYRATEMAESHVAAQPMGRFKGLAGELMKVGFVTYPKGKMSRPHYHPNEEQFLFILEGRQWMIVGDEEGLVVAGDLVHIPRNTKHGGVIIDDVRMFTAKSPLATAGSIRITMTRKTQKRSYAAWRKNCANWCNGAAAVVVLSSNGGLLNEKCTHNLKGR